jgi:hypothetical protein
LLYRALDAKIGISVATNDVERLRAKLYSDRRAAQNPAFENLVIKPSHTQPTAELWIVRKDITNASA